MYKIYTKSYTCTLSLTTENNIVKIIIVILISNTTESCSILEEKTQELKSQYCFFVQ